MSEQGERDSRKAKSLAAREALRLLEQLASELMDGPYKDSLLHDVLPTLRRVPPEQEVAADFFEQPAARFRHFGQDMLSTVIGCNEELKKRLIKQGKESESARRIQEWIGYQVTGSVPVAEWFAGLQEVQQAPRAAPQPEEPRAVSEASGWPQITAEAWSKALEETRRRENELGRDRPEQPMIWPAGE